jgi:hypothetical protein
MVDKKQETHSNPNISEAREHFRAARKSMRKSFESLLPAGFRENRRQAQSEFLHGMRKMVDAAIEHTEKAD